VKFNDIKRFPHASYIVNVPWIALKEWLYTKESIEGYKVELNPEYQRDYVWREQQKIKYIEYILKGGFSSRDIFWNCSSWMKGFNTPLEIVDGKQRISAVLDFLDNKIKAFEYYLSEYKDKIHWDYDFIFHINNLQTRLDVLRWYLSLNDGGTIHTKKDLNKVKLLIIKERKKERRKSEKTKT
jgi:uncharacterized protein with ParB-like and HNH nuclease domain